jgi:uncharacterized membrane protein
MATSTVSTSGLLRAALLGAATGCRSQLGLAVLAWSGKGRGSHAIGRTLTGRPGRVLTSVAATAELVVDQLPKTPSRLEPGGLGARAVLGSLGGAVVAGRSRSAAAPAAAVGLGAALVTAYAGVRWRRAAATRFGRDAPGALAVAVLLAWLAVR